MTRIGAWVFPSENLPLAQGINSDGDAVFAGITSEGRLTISARGSIPRAVLDELYRRYDRIQAPILVGGEPT